MKSFLAITVVAMLTVSCGGQYVLLKNGQNVSESETKNDELSCKRDAASLFPYAAAVSGSGVQSGGGSANCNQYVNRIDCSMSGGYATSSITTSDGNASNREKHYKLCMAALGYKWEFVADGNDAGNYDVATSTNEPTAIMGCKSNSDCGQGEACRSTKGGGTECRGSGTSLDYKRQTKNECKSSSDCSLGKSCRSIKGGGTECR